MKVINVHHRGNIANRMIQYMFARHLQYNVPGSIVTGYDIPGTSIKSKYNPEVPYNAIEISRQDVRLDKVISAMRSGLVDFVNLRGFFQDVRYYDNVDFFRAMFEPHFPAPPSDDDGKILINIRAGEILNGVHPLYYPLPIEYYKYIVAVSGRDPVFFGQVSGEDRYTEKLRASFPNAEFRASGDPISDFGALMNGRHIAIALSSFSWLGAYLSRAENIYVPMTGLLNPATATGMHFIPYADARMRVIDVPDARWNPGDCRHELSGDQLVYGSVNMKRLGKILRKDLSKRLR